MAVVSARPANLGAFVRDAAEARGDLADDVTTMRAAYDSFQTSGSIKVANPDLMGTDLPGLLERYATNETFVDVVRVAFVNADTGSGPNGVAVADEAYVARAFDRQATSLGLDPAVLSSTPSAITVDDPTLGGVPQTSGFVDDPVCTGSGHLVEQEDDFVWPDRLAVLRWTRTYSSRFVGDGPFGRGWATWASVGCSLEAGSVDYRGPDGQRVTAPLDGNGRFVAIGCSARVEPAAGGFDLVWDAQTRRAGQRWRFGPDGLPVTVTGPGLGTTSFVHEDGRLTEVRHGGGRSLRLVWDGDRVGELRSSCGRTARYQYDPAGDLVGVQRVAGDRRYDLDDAGRITAMWDADGVRLCLNTYDADGRVLRQLSPLGRETVLDYQPGRRTIVGDTEGGPETTYIHDEAGRLVRVALATGAAYERSFDERGRCTGVKSIDGYRASQHHDDDTIALRDSAGVRRVRLDANGAVAELDDGHGAVFRFERHPGEWYPHHISGPEAWFVELDGSPDTGCVRITDADGVTYEQRFDGDGNVVARTSADGATTVIERDPSGAATTVVLPDGGRIEVAHDAAGLWLERRTPMGGVARRVMSPEGRMLEQTDRDGSRWTLDRDTRGAVVEAIDPSGGAHSWTYDTSGRVITSTHPDESKWSFDYDALGQLSLLDGPTGVRLFSHDPAGRLIAATTATGRTLRFERDDSGRTTELLDDDGPVALVRVDRLGRLVERHDATGGVTRVERDLLGRPTLVELPDGARLARRYSPAGRLMSVDIDGARTTYGYDTAGRLRSITEPGETITTLTWDVCGRLAERCGPTGSVERWRYDRDGRLTTRDIDGARWQLGHRVTATTVISAPDSATTAVVVDWQRQPVLVSDPLGHEHTIGRDAVGNQVSLTNPLGVTAAASVDASGRTVARTDALGHATVFERDAVGGVVKVRRPSGGTVGFRRSGRGAVREVTVDGRPWITGELDGAGRPLVVHEARRQRTHRLLWSPGGQLLRLSTDGRTMSWERDRLGRISARHVDGVGGWRTARDAAGRVVGVRGDSWDARIRRDDAGRPVHVEADALERRWQRDAAGRVGAGWECVAGHERSYHLVRDDMGRIVTADSDDGSWRFTRDAAGQLVRSEQPDGEWSWVYDAAGRLARELGPAGERAFAYDAADRLIAVTDEAGTTALAPDADGHRTAAHGPHGLAGLRWDGLGRASALCTVDGDIPLDVDAFGCLVAAADHTMVWDPSGRQAELVAIDDDAVIGLPGVCPGLATNAGVRWLTLDWQGSVVPGDVWGKSAPSSPTPQLGYRGELSVAGMVWLRNRWYDPVARSFVSPDPLHGRLGSPTLGYRYHYAGNDPVGRVDPDGRKPLSLEEYEAIRQDEIGFQLDNIAQAGLTVVATGVAAPLEMAVQTAKPLAGVGAVALALANGETDLGDLARHYQNGVPTLLSLGVAATFGDADDITYDDESGMWVATGVNDPWAGPRGGFTTGSTFLSPHDDVDDLLMQHESVHGDQWALFGGGLRFPIAYGIEELFNPGTQNQYEQQAGLGKGCYKDPHSDDEERPFCTDGH